MIVCNEQKGESGCEVCAEGPLTIEEAAGLKTALTDAFNSRRPVTVELSGVTEADLTCIQLLCALCKSSSRLDRDVRVLGRSGGVAAAAKAGGFPGSNCSCGGSCWLKGGSRV